jgi:hypothetical protein
MFALVQVVWFTTSTFSRLVLHLSITTLELTTLGFILCMLITSFLWWNKPYGIGQAEVLTSNTKLTDILLNAGDAAGHPYQHTPPDFVSREEWSVSLFWTYYVNTVQRFGIPIFARPTRAGPYDRIPTINWPMFGGFLPKLSWGILSTTYSAIFIYGWNLSFPTTIERDLWRISSVYLTSYVLLMAPFDLYYFTASESKPSRNTEILLREPGRGGSMSFQSRPEWHKLLLKRFKIMATMLRNSSPEKDPMDAISLRALIPVTLLCALYTLARAYILVEDVLGLRALPDSAFQTVNWSRYFPHL